MRALIGHELGDDSLSGDEGRAGLPGLLRVPLPGGEVLDDALSEAVLEDALHDVLLRLLGGLSLPGLLRRRGLGARGRAWVLLSRQLLPLSGTHGPEDAGPDDDGLPGHPLEQHHVPHRQLLVDAPASPAPAEPPTTAGTPQPDDRRVGAGFVAEVDAVCPLRRGQGWSQVRGQLQPEPSGDMGWQHDLGGGAVLAGLTRFLCLAYGLFYIRRVWPNGIVPA
mmetsp:Transcript_50336/g.89934  ORF Transcript_50336/g.89934 Transcript_50336/m.89934 type:complete len:222 (+) Transcript_50336:120-785(+)